MFKLRYVICIIINLTKTYQTTTIPDSLILCPGKAAIFYIILNIVKIQNVTIFVPPSPTSVLIHSSHVNVHIIGDSYILVNGWTSAC